MVNSLRGRPKGGSDARERLISHAHTAFLRDGYGRTSIRGIAREAGVSHTLVNYYFGSREGLFGEVMAISLRPSRIAAQALASRPGASPLERAHHLVTTLLTVWDDRALSKPLIQLLRQAVSSDELRGVIAGFVRDEIVGQLIEEVRGVDASPRAAAITSAMSGAIFTRYLLAVEPMASLSRADMARVLAPMVAIHLPG